METFLAAAEVLRRHERINSNVYLMLGFPGETVGMIRDTIDVSLRMNLDWYRIKPLQPLPSTPIYQTMIEQGLIDEADPQAVRYITGAYGKHVGMERDTGAAGADFRRAIEALPADHVPNRALIDDLWFYMNYRLNYERVLGETRPVKLDQARRVLQSICDLIAPDNAFALYTLAAVQRRIDGAPSPAVVERLLRQQATSPFWRDRLAAFALDPDRRRRLTGDPHTARAITAWRALLPQGRPRGSAALQRATIFSSVRATAQAVAEEEVHDLHRFAQVPHLRGTALSWGIIDGDLADAMAGQRDQCGDLGAVLPAVLAQALERHGVAADRLHAGGEIGEPLVEQQVEEARHQPVAEPPRQRHVRRSRAEEARGVHRRRLLERRQEVRNRLGRVLEVGVDDDDALAVGRRDAVAHRRAPAEIGGVADDAQPRMRGEPRQGAVGRRVVHEDQRVGQPETVAAGVELVDALDLVVDGDDDVDRARHQPAHSRTR